MAKEDTSRFDWDRHNVGHVAKHKVKPQEVEQVLRNGPILIETEIDENSGEERITEIGHTNTGRISVRRVDAPPNKLPSRNGLCGRPQNPRAIHWSEIQERL